MTLEINFQAVTLCRHYVGNKLYECENVLRLWYENVLNGQKFYCVMKFSRFSADKSFSTGNVLRVQRTCPSYGKKVGTKLFRLLWQENVTQEHPNQVFTVDKPYIHIKKE
jgi:hypothetical protein